MSHGFAATRGREAHEKNEFVSDFHVIFRHGRACPGLSRLVPASHVGELPRGRKHCLGGCDRNSKWSCCGTTWMAGTSPAMTAWSCELQDDRFIPRGRPKTGAERNRRESRCGDDAAVSGHQDDLERGIAACECAGGHAPGGLRDETGQVEAVALHELERVQRAIGRRDLRGQLRPAARRGDACAEIVHIDLAAHANADRAGPARASSFSRRLRRW